MLDHQLVNLLSAVPPGVTLRGWSDVDSDGVNPLRTGLAETVAISTTVPHSLALKLWSPGPVQLQVDGGQGAPQVVRLPGGKEATVIVQAKRTTNITADCKECYLAYGMSVTLHRPVEIAAAERAGSIILAVLLLVLLARLLFRRSQ